MSFSFRTPGARQYHARERGTHQRLQRANLLTLYPATTLTEIRPGHVVLAPVKNPGVDSLPLDGPTAIDNDVIFAMIGAELPTAFLKQIGVKLVSKGRLGLA